MTDTDPQDATVYRSGADTVLRFERVLSHPVGKVWAALTDPAECARWLGVLGHELVQDGPFELSGDDGPMASGKVTELVPPDGAATAVVEYTWHATFADAGSAVIRWELTPTGDRTRLVLTQTAAGTAFLAEGAAGWHGFLDQIAWALSVADDQTDPHADRTAEQQEWRTRRSRYCAEFGVPPNPAIP
jgi:uncharacterized protein YndB with AHSA1/START domain